MILKAFAILDTKANAFLQPFFMPATGMATRAFADMVNNKELPMYRHADDYRLAEIGTFNDSNGHLETTAEPNFIGSGTDFKEN